MNTADLFTSLMVFAYVLVVMGAIVAAISLLAKIADRPSPAAKEPDSDELSPEIIAVLTAAAMETLGQPVAIHSARLHREADHPTWASAGRIDIMLSHRVGPRR